MTQKIEIPGKILSHQANPRVAFPSERIFPR